MDVRVTVIGRYTRKTETIIQDADNILDAKDKFAREKGYDSFGDMWASYNEVNNSPPYTFNKLRK